MFSLVLGNRSGTSKQSRLTLSDIVICVSIKVLGYQWDNSRTRGGIGSYRCRYQSSGLSMRQQPYAGRNWELPVSVSKFWVINETTPVRGEELGVTGVGIKVLGYQWDNSRTWGGIGSYRCRYQSSRLSMRQQPYAGRNWELPVSVSKFWVINETTAVRGEELGVTGVGIKVLGYQWDNSRTWGGIGSYRCRYQSSRLSMRQQPYAGRNWELPVSVSKFWVINETTAVRGEELGVTGVSIKVLGYQWDNSRTWGGIGSYRCRYQSSGLSMRQQPYAGRNWELPVSVSKF